LKDVLLHRWIGWGDRGHLDFLSVACMDPQPNPL
jgi:hypothetical protein